jgi:hypothetical protein
MSTVKVTYLPYIPPASTHAGLYFDLADEAQWEDVAAERGLLDTLEAVGLEEANPIDNRFTSSVYDYAAWFYDGDESAFSVI